MVINDNEDGGAKDLRQMPIRTGTRGTGRAVASRTGEGGRITLVSSETQFTERQVSGRAGLPAPGGRATPPVVVAWTSAPGWRRTPVTSSLLAIGQLHPHSATAESPA